MMNLWQRLQEHGRGNFNLGDDWYLYAVELSDEDNWAEVKLARKDGDKWITKDDFTGGIEYFDIR